MASIRTPSYRDYSISDPSDAATWQKMVAIKSSILRRMDNEPAGVRLCCIKFIQSVVQVQTPGMIADPRRPEQNEISLALVPRNHPVIPPSNLEAEASGLLDRLLFVIQDNSSEALIVTATLNSLGSLVKSRASVANKIVSTILSFNPFTLAQAHSPITAKDKVLIRSLTRTTMSFLANILKRAPNHQLAGRIQGTLDRLRHSLMEVFDETSRKRPAPSEPTDGLSDAKRQRLGAETHQPPQAPNSYPPLPPGPTTYAQLFTLTTEANATNFDVKVIPIDIVQRIVPALLASVDRSKMDNAINAVRSRYLSLSKKPQPQNAVAASTTATGVDTSAVDEDDDYEPDYPIENKEQVLNDLDQQGGDDAAPLQEPEVGLGAFSLPPLPPMSEEETIEHSKGAVNRVFGALSTIDASASNNKQRHGFNRLAASNHDRDAWVTVISRLATRSGAGLSAKSETQALSRAFSAGDTIRDALYMYVVEDFRRRIDVAISWLNEEWYNDRIQSQQYEADKDTTEGSSPPIPQYNRQLHRVLDGILPFLDAKDKFLIRFLSEIPAVDQSVLNRVVKLAADPERVMLAVLALQYQIMYRPPIRELCLDSLEQMARDHSDARPSVKKVLAKYRPAALEDGVVNGDAPKVESVKAEA
ncbi:hypothetical protein MBLNU457_g0705t2 [Dothideomycetes sp. NU457]